MLALFSKSWVFDVFLQMAYVENQLQTYISRTSYIQARLLSTLDALDALQALHNRELASEIHAKRRLSDKLDRYINFVHAMETEKEDLRDAVVQLVEKGGSVFMISKREAVLLLRITCNFSRNVKQL
jgi:hypothetical protein